MSKKETEEKINPADFTLEVDDKENFKKAIIARSNLTNRFTVENVESQQKNLEKMDRELSAQVKVSKAVLDNVKRNHKTIFELSDEDLSVASYLFENKKLLTDSEAKLKEVNKISENYKKILALIYEKFGFVASEAPDVSENK